MRNATRVETRRPIAPARKKNRRRPQSRRNLSACHSRVSSSGTSGSEASPITGNGAVSGWCLVAVCVTSVLSHVPVFQIESAFVHFHFLGQKVNWREAVTFDG